MKILKKNKIENSTKDVFSMLGKSINSDGVKNMIKEFKSFLPPKTETDNKGNITFATSYNDSIGVVFNFEGLNKFQKKYGNPVEYNDKNNDELILTKIRFNDLQKFNKKCPLIELPYKLKYGAVEKEVKSAISVKPYESSNIYGGGKFQIFDCGLFQTWVEYNIKGLLIKLDFYYFETVQKQKLVLKKNIAFQKKNIKPENQTNVKLFINKIPEMYDSRLVSKNSTAVKNLEIELNRFVKSVTDYTSKRNSKGIYNEISKVVKSINSIHFKNVGFIETMEREILCDFINSVIKSTGFQIGDNIDITEDNREW